MALLFFVAYGIVMSVMTGQTPSSPAWEARLRHLVRPTTSATPEEPKIAVDMSHPASITVKDLASDVQ